MSAILFDHHGDQIKENVIQNGAIREIHGKKIYGKKQLNKKGQGDDVRTTSMEEEEAGRATKFWFCLLVLCARITCTTAVDTISANQTIRDGETIVSAQGTFELGFFRPKNSRNRYVGIWYNKIASGTVVWVANRNTPLTNTSGDLSLTLQGILLLRNASGDVIWSSLNSSATSVRKPVGQLLDTGNFMVREETEAEGTPIWQSFDFPTDTSLAGMKWGKDLVTGLERYLTSWKSEDDPSVGEYSARIETEGYPQLILWDGPNIRFRVGPWNGLRYSGGTAVKVNPYYKFHFVLDDKEIYYYFDLINNSVPSRLVIQPSGTLERLVWFEDRQEWSVFSTSLFTQSETCNRYSLCGSFGICDNSKTPPCGCLEGFVPTSQGGGNVGNQSQGCRLSTPLDCGPGEGFKKYSSLKLPDTHGSWFNQSMNLDECEKVCKSNCSCTAYTTQNITGSGSGCLLWFGNLTDIRTFPDGQDLYIRMPASELTKSKSSSVKRRVKIIVPIILVLLVIQLSVCLFIQLKRRKAKQEVTIEEQYGEYSGNEEAKDDLELPLIDFFTLQKATNNFSYNNKLGEGGFGPVYKGVLENGQEVAVKRLARTSTQGFDEFKTEVKCISKLQHRNLVRLLYCCIKGEEKMLVYEYMQNKGLDDFIFDETQSKLLDWPMRFQIIKGIARGLLYLHQDSRLRIIHRDLKVSNILLDHDMVPKISDFGMARSFGGHQMEANTNRVVGTYGYMAPEYAANGVFSIKSDVFSFGVLVLEIVSGKRNRGFFHKDHSNNLLGHAWRLHKEGRSLELVAASLDESIRSLEVLRSIHVCLLCVQQHPEDRPTMSSVVLMFESAGELPPPKPPGFFYEKATTDTIHSSSTFETNSTNELTITMLSAR